MEGSNSDIVIIIFFQVFSKGLFEYYWGVSPPLGGFGALGNFGILGPLRLILAVYQEQTGMF